MFQGFSQGAVDFLWGVRFNNERSWFEAHKQEYLDLVIAPLQELGRQVHAAMTAAYPKEQLNLYVSRIYRDARRLHGRGPYKEWIYPVILFPPCFSVMAGQKRAQKSRPSGPLQRPDGRHGDDHTPCGFTPLPSVI